MTDFDKASGGTFYNGAPVSKDYCPWTLKVYATEDLEDAYVTTRSYYYMAAVLGMFLFTCSVFILYDFFNEKRQKKVMTNAVKSDKIVASLFPGTFREAMYDQQAQDDEEEKNRHTSTFQANTIGDGSLSRQWHRSSIGSSESSRKRNNGDPMAQLYPNCKSACQRSDFAFLFDASHTNYMVLQSNIQFRHGFLCRPGRFYSMVWQPHAN